MVLKTTGKQSNSALSTLEKIKHKNYLIIHLAYLKNRFWNSAVTEQSYNNFVVRIESLIIFV